MTNIKERPILFNAPMVRAILEGRKTVTRRAVRAGFNPNDLEGTLSRSECRRLHRELPQYFGAAYFCPYGQPGDRLWVRETWGVISHTWNEHGDMVDWVPDRPATAIRELPFGRGYYSGHVIYAADGANEWAGDDDGGGEPRSAWHPSIHMPRAACRILLEITHVRVERLQDISREQCIAEGPQYPVADHLARAWHVQFRDLWQSTGGNWDANPWVWVVEFKRVTP